MTSRQITKEQLRYLTAFINDLQGELTIPDDYFSFLKKSNKILIQFKACGTAAFAQSYLRWLLFISADRYSSNNLIGIPNIAYGERNSKTGPRKNAGIEAFWTILDEMGTFHWLSEK